MFQFFNVNITSKQTSIHLENINIIFLRPTSTTEIESTKCSRLFTFEENKIVWHIHLFSQNPATNTENSAQSWSEHIFMELTLFVYNINSQYFCIKSGLNYLRYKRYKRNETGGHIFFCNLNFHSNGIYILYIDCYHHRKIYILHCLVVSLYIEHFWTIIYHINTFKSYFQEIFCKSWFIFGIHKANIFV